MKLNATHKSSEVPRAKIKKQTALSLIWLVPLAAAIVAIVLVVQNIQKLGPMITIQFDDGNGLDTNQTVIRYRGVRVGGVHSVKLATDTRHVEVRARLERSAAGLAREGSIFWVVRPEVGAAGFHALETIVSGPYIQVLPGSPNGKIQTELIGANEAPLIKENKNGVEFILRSSQIRSLAQGSPVYYRGLEVGAVEYLDLSGDATSVNIHVLIKTSFAPLVRQNTVWWNAGGINMDLHFLGINMTAENLKSLITGGVAFATPDETA